MTGKHAKPSPSGVFLPYLKAYAALVGSICTALLAIYADGEVGKILTAVSVVATVVGTWAVPNLDPAGRRQDESVQPPDRIRQRNRRKGLR